MPKFACPLVFAHWSIRWRSDIIVKLLNFKIFDAWIKFEFHSNFGKLEFKNMKINVNGVNHQINSWRVTSLPSFQEDILGRQLRNTFFLTHRVKNVPWWCLRKWFRKEGKTLTFYLVIWQFDTFNFNLHILKLNISRSMQTQILCSSF